MSSPRNTGRAVPGAIRINRCVELLQSAFIARTEQGWAGGPYSEWLAQAYANDPSRSDWLRRERAEHDAEWTILRAIQSGVLPVHAYFDDGPGVVDPDELGELAHNSLAAGAYQPVNDWSGEHAGRSLWVFESDWTEFMNAMLSSLSQSDGTQRGGRPNKRNEAIELHIKRREEGTALTGRMAEAKAISLILSKRHASDPKWKYEAASIVRALRSVNDAQG